MKLVSENTLVVRGLRPLQASMRRADRDALRDLRRDLRELGNSVRDGARSNAPVGPRPKRSATPPLAGSLRVSVTDKGVSVYSNAAHAYVQDRGGRVGRGAIITRARASGYLSRAVAGVDVQMTRKLNDVLDRIDSTITTTGA
ncbi:MAG: hypothetical protein Q8O56_12845 [Solirubrobacteraceae bacterium]|nr:hypothetical protein [Solirubrobacteraceae bacterium]